MNKIILLGISITVTSLGYAEIENILSNSLEVASEQIPIEARIFQIEAQLAKSVAEFQRTDTVLRAKRRAYISQLKANGGVSPYSELEFREANTVAYARVEELRQEVARIQEELMAHLIRGQGNHPVAGAGRVSSTAGQVLQDSLHKRHLLEVEERIDAVKRGGGKNLNEENNPSSEQISE